MYRIKRKFEQGTFAAETTLGEPKRKTTRGFGGNSKVKVLTDKFVSVTNVKSGKTEKAEILRVVKNPANVDYNRRGVITKGAEIETGSAELVTVGFIAITLTPEVAFANGIPENTQGVIALETEGLALQAGMIDGDIIRAINGTPTPDLLSVLKKIKRCDVSKGITFSLIRQGQPCEVVVKENKPSLLPKGL